MSTSCFSNSDAVDFAELSANKATFFATYNPTNVDPKFDSFQLTNHLAFQARFVETYIQSVIETILSAD